MHREIKGRIISRRLWDEYYSLQTDEMSAFVFFHSLKHGFISERQPQVTNLFENQMV
jgi:hypothetical protein